MTSLTPGCQVLSFLWFSVFFNGKKNYISFLENGVLKCHVDFICLFPLYLTSQHLIMTRSSLQVWFSSSTHIWKIRWRLGDSHLWRRGDGEREEEGREREKRLVFAEVGAKPTSTRECYIWKCVACPDDLKPLIYLF